MPERPRLGLRRRRLPSEPDFAPVYKAAIEAALRWAWKEVRAGAPETVRSGHEEEITERVQRALNEQDPKTARRRAPGMEGFETVDRGAKVTTADGRIEKQPDLVFRLVVGAGVRHRGDWGMFVECKIIDAEPNHSPDAYCAKGLAKFVHGEYASRMGSGAMVAYVRDGRQPYATLSESLHSAYGTLSHKPDPTLTRSFSQHDRSQLANPCVDITMTHLWLDASTAPPATGVG